MGVIVFGKLAGLTPLAGARPNSPQPSELIKIALLQSWPSITQGRYHRRFTRELPGRSLTVLPRRSSSSRTWHRRLVVLIAITMTLRQGERRRWSF
jgi:hypothetical protein